MLDASVSVKGLLFGRLGWDCTERMLSHPQLCQDISARLLKIPDALRLRDTTAQLCAARVTFLCL